MKTFVLHMYRVLDELMQYDDEYVLQLAPAPFVALLESNDPAEPTRQQKVKKYNLRPFEIQQNLMELTIEKAAKNNISILRIEFDFPIDDELEDEFIYAIQNDKFKKIISLINEVREEVSDIKALTFLYNSRQYRVTKYGVVEMDGDFEELSYLTYHSPVALLTGIRQTIN